MGALPSAKIPRAQWNGTFRLHGPDPSHRAFGYRSCKAGYKRAVLQGQQFCQMERDSSVRQTDRNDRQTGRSGPPSKVLPNIPVRPNRNGPFHLISNRKFRNFRAERKEPSDTRREIQIGLTY